MDYLNSDPHLLLLQRLIEQNSVTQKTELTKRLTLFLLFIFTCINIDILDSHFRESIEIFLIQHSISDEVVDGIE